MFSLLPHQNVDWRNHDGITTHSVIMSIYLSSPRQEYGRLQSRRIVKEVLDESSDVGCSLQSNATQLVLQVCVTCTLIPLYMYLLGPKGICNNHCKRLYGGTPP